MKPSSALGRVGEATISVDILSKTTTNLDHITMMMVCRLDEWKRAVSFVGGREKGFKSLD